jgi:dienelactone hydrolase
MSDGASASSPQPFAISGPGGGTLHGLVDLPAAPGPRPAVVICHGFKGYMEWAFFPALAALLAERGYVAVRFNLSGAGMLPGDERVTDPAAFKNNTHSAELADLLRILEATGTEIAPDRIDRDRLALVGHSRGGAAAILAAARDPWRTRCRALVTWAAIASVDRYSPADKKRAAETGELPVINSRTGQRLALGRPYFEDVARNATGTLDVQAAAARVAAPWLIVHGADDETVAAAEAATLARAATARHEVLIVPGGSHTFGSRHPFSGPTPALIQALNATQTWLRRYLPL